jgi:hypothetical protein
MVAVDIVPYASAHGLGLPLRPGKKVGVIEIRVGATHFGRVWLTCGKFGLAQKHGMINP